MEEDKVQRLHDSLSKLRKSSGLGASSHFNFSGGTRYSISSISQKGENGELIREDGLPMNALYTNFVRQGLYDPTKKKQNDASKYGDGRFIKQNFDDSTSEAGKSDVSSNESREEKLQRKAEKRKKKKAAKLERKKQAKLEEKKRAKLEAKRLVKKIELEKESGPRKRSTLKLVEKNILVQKESDSETKISPKCLEKIIIAEKEINPSAKCTLDIDDQVRKKSKTMFKTRSKEERSENTNEKIGKIAYNDNKKKRRKDSSTLKNKFTSSKRK